MKEDAMRQQNAECMLSIHGKPFDVTEFKRHIQEEDERQYGNGNYERI